jgi:pilus assembly protein CpaB
MVGLVAFGLATVATFSIFLYVHEVKQRAVTGGAQVTVVVSKKDIPTGTSLDTLIGQGAFTTETIPQKTEVQGAVTSLEQLKGRRTSVPILAGEQIPMARLQGSTALPGGAFGIPTGYEAMTLQLDSARIVGGLIRTGDHVSLYATFQPPVTKYETITLVPDVRVLRVSAPTVDHPTDGTFVTMALRTGDAERVVFAQENGLVWMALQPPGQTGTRVGPVTIGGLAR